jgi:hypothetical protein
MVLKRATSRQAAASRRATSRCQQASRPALAPDVWASALGGGCARRLQPRVQMNGQPMIVINVPDKGKADNMIGPPSVVCSVWCVVLATGVLGGLGGWAPWPIALPHNHMPAALPPHLPSCTPAVLPSAHALPRSCCSCPRLLVACSVHMRMGMLERLGRLLKAGECALGVRQVR